MMRAVPGYPLADFAEDVNCVASFLALRDPPPAAPADILVLLGNSVVAVAERAFAAMRDGAAHRLLIAGGRGHATPFLAENLARSRYAGIARDDRSEAEMLADVAVRYWGLTSREILVETESANCGENARFALRLLHARTISARNLILMQDPTMQRRTDASFRKVWRDAAVEARFWNDPTGVPEVGARDGILALEGEMSGSWPVERFVSLVMGEIPRLRDDASGYGPKGRGWIEHVEIPDTVQAAHARVARFHPEFVRPPWAGSQPATPGSA